MHETLSHHFTIYVRDRRPAVHFHDQLWLRETGQRVFTSSPSIRKTVAVEIYRISDRNLIDTIEGARFGQTDFQRSLAPYDIDNLKNSVGLPVWQGELAVDNSPLNQDVTTAFPVDQAVGDLKPGVYVMVAQPKEMKGADNYDSLATQWFIVSDLGLSSFSGNDGIHVFVNSLATTDAKNGIDVQLVSRGNEVLATRKTDPSGHACSKPVSPRARAAAPALRGDRRQGRRLRVPQSYIDSL